MTGMEQELERLLVSQRSGPCKRRESLVVWIWVADAGALHEPSHERQIVL
jgi:hypothetical protein